MQQHATYDIVICGAGPAGSSVALALRQSGLRVALIDRATFPRDKVCGDAIPGRAIKNLQKIGEEYARAFRRHAPALITRSTALYYKSRQISFDWVGEAYTCARMDFDNFLFTQVVETTKTDVYTGISITSVSKAGDGYTVTAKDGSSFTCRMLIGADGAQSVTAKALAKRTIDRDNHVGSVRAYYSGITGLDPHTTEVYFDRKYLPSYLWVFPLPGNRANVGFGMLSSEIARRRVDLKKLFYEFIDSTPTLRYRLGAATAISPLEGFGLPLGARKLTISGDNYILTGDAASLIDPISGDGIGNAVLSGRLSAAQAIKCFQQNNFSASFISEYDTLLNAAIGKELRTHYHARRALARAPLLLDTIFAVCQLPVCKKIVQKGL